MNILFFLIPKNEVDVVYENDNYFQAITRMSTHKFSTIPIIDETNGRYVGTLSEGDFLREFIKKDEQPLKQLKDRSIRFLKRKKDYRPVRIGASVDELYSMALEQNFIPVVDDTGTFIGIVTRKTLLQHVLNKTAE